jgi:hypothetical protein
VRDENVNVVIPLIQAHQQALRAFPRKREESRFKGFDALRMVSGSRSKKVIKVLFFLLREEIRKAELNEILDLLMKPDQSSANIVESQTPYSVFAFHQCFIEGPSLNPIKDIDKKSPS